MFGKFFIFFAIVTVALAIEMIEINQPIVRRRRSSPYIIDTEDATGLLSKRSTDSKDKVPHHREKPSGSHHMESSDKKEKDPPCKDEEEDSKSESNEHVRSKRLDYHTHHSTVHYAPKLVPVAVTHDVRYVQPVHDHHYYGSHHY